MICLAISSQYRRIMDRYNILQQHGPCYTYALCIMRYKQEGEANMEKSARYKSIRQMAAQGHISNRVLSIHAFTREQVMPTCSLGLSHPIRGGFHPPSNTMWHWLRPTNESK